MAAGLLSGEGTIAFDQSPWQPFRWFGADIGHERLERGVLLVPVRLKGLPGEHHFQLDLGASQSSLHGGAVQDLGSSFILGRRGMTVAGTMAGVVVADEPVEVLADFRATVVRGKRIPIIGTLGLSFFEHRILVLDYPAGRFAVLPENEPLPGNLEARATFRAAIKRNGKLYVPIEVDGEPQTGFFFDTGASSFPLVTSQDAWRRLTGLRGDEALNQRRTVSSWDADITLVGAEMMGEMRLGPAVLQRPVIWFTSDRRLSFDAWPATAGLLGNELFADRFVVIVDVAHGRFGIATSDVAQPNKRMEPTRN